MYGKNACFADIASRSTCLLPGVPTPGLFRGRYRVEAPMECPIARRADAEDAPPICLFIACSLSYIHLHPKMTFFHQHPEASMSIPRFEKEWDGFKGHVAVTWDKIPDEDLLKIEGNFGKLVSLISDKYGEKKTVVEEKVKELYDGYISTRERLAEGLSEVRENLHSRSEDFAAGIKDRANIYQEKAKERINRIREENIEPAVQKSEEYIKVHPFSAVMGAFGVGMLIGGVIGLLSTRKE
jgi:ElaB/YqjD/DUF883 family membrane-anchored ribosome-binding protein